MMSRCEETNEVKIGKLQAHPRDMNMVRPGGATGMAAAWLIPQSVREPGSTCQGQ